MSTAAQSDRMDVVTKQTREIRLPNGEPLVLAALSLNDWSSARLEALNDYRREKISAWTSNADLMPPESRAQWIRDAFHRAEQISYHDLPKMEVEVPETDYDGIILYDGTGKPKLTKTMADYDVWWMSQSVRGRMFMIWLSARKEPRQRDLTMDQLSDIFADAIGDLDNAAQSVIGISESRVLKNSDAPPPIPSGPEGKKERRRMRRNRII